ncbi:MAG: metallophosphoesterase [Bacteroidales bacterium]|nr:metallophosphoesterase [Bacteroidales bacterium]MBQ6307850.1 metallophosphoesterase [Bacteroidales bacterium]
MPTFNNIGDIHGQDSWKRLVDEGSINVFVGDYFDPYLDLNIEDLERNFMEVVEYKRKHRKNTVLLYGNHDMDFFPSISERNSRYDEVNAFWIQQLFTASEWLFHGVAYAIGDNYLVTHAGVTKEWKETYLSGTRSIHPANMAKAINSLWKKGKSHPPHWVRLKTKRAETCIILKFPPV